MRIQAYLLAAVLCSTLHSIEAQDIQHELTALVDSFFIALEEQDTIALRTLRIEGAFDHYINEKTTPHRIASRSGTAFNLKPDQLIKERAKDDGIVILHERNIAMAWVPYDLWVNDVYWHCGVDIFSFLKTEGGWKIASITYSAVIEGCR